MVSLIVLARVRKCLGINCLKVAEQDFEKIHPLHTGKLMTKEDISESGKDKSRISVIPGFKDFPDEFHFKLNAAIVQASINSNS